MSSRLFLIIVVLALVLSMTGGVLADPLTAGPKPGDAFVADEVVVKFKDGVDFDREARGVGGRVNRHEAALGVHVLKVPSGMVEKVVEALGRDPNVEYAEPNGIATIFVDPNDPYDNTTCYNTSKAGCVTQWGWAKIQAYQAWDIT